jgi:hypothetical protein
MTADRCAAVCGVLVCDREPGHLGEHRGYWPEHDAVLFWRDSDPAAMRVEMELRDGRIIDLTGLDIEAVLARLDALHVSPDDVKATRHFLPIRPAKDEPEK